MTPVAEIPYAGIIKDKLATFGIECRIGEVRRGPQTTRIKIHPAEGVRMRDISRTVADLAYALGTPTPPVVLAPLPGEPNTVALEIASPSQLIMLSGLAPAVAPLEVSLGVDMDGNTMRFDIVKAVHTLIAAMTGGGKTGCVNAVLASALSVLGPDLLRLVLIDLKGVESQRYERLPHLLTPPATSVEDAENALEGVRELVDLRFRAMQLFGARDIDEMNLALARAGRRPYPRILVIIDELADLMAASKKYAESLIAAIAAKARAAGIHLIVATQSPRVGVVTGLIKANIGTRIAFAVSSMTDSRVILDQNGAERLLGKGDGLLSLGGAQPVRFQAAWVSSDEIDAICERWR